MNLPVLPARARAMAISVSVVLIVAGCSSGGPASTAARPPSSVLPSASPSTVPGAAAPSPTATALPQPVDSSVDGVAVRTLERGPLSAPIDVVVAFGSVWVANHRGSSVTRVDPETMKVQATIRTGQGPGWFVVTDDAVWVSNQMGVGMTRVDPETGDTADAGDWPTCGRAILAFDSIWQPACGMQLVMRIDPTGLTSTNVASDQTAVVRVGSTLMSGGPSGLARLDPKTNAFVPIGGEDPGWLMAFDGRTIWSSDEHKVFRINPVDGAVIATLEIPEAGSVAFRDGRTWVTSSTGLVEVAPKTNAIVRTLPLGPTLSIVNDTEGLWVTSFDGNSLMRVRP